MSCSGWWDVYSSLISGKEVSPVHEIQQRDTNGVFQIHNQQIWLVSQIVDLRPEKRDASAYLYETEPSYVSTRTPSWLLNEKDLLRFIEVGDIAVMVYTATKEPGTSPEAATAANEGQLHPSPLHNSGFDFKGFKKRP
jgi:hypothetical protein